MSTEGIKGVDEIENSTRPDHLPVHDPKRDRKKRIRQQSWHEIMWRLNAVRTYLENTDYHAVPGMRNNKRQFCDAEPLFNILEQPFGAEFFGNLHMAPSGAYTVNFSRKEEFGGEEPPGD